MAFFQGLEDDMFSLLETLNNKATEVSDSVKTSINNFEQDVNFKSLVLETNDRMSKMFSLEEDEDFIVSSEESLEPDHHAVRAGDTSPADLPGYDEELPGYAQPCAYLDESEQCVRRNLTNRKITEADLDEDDPLYRERSISEQEMDNGQGRDGGTDPDIIQCFITHLERFKIMLMESLAIS